MAENRMLEIVEENKLAPAQAKPLLESFGDFFVSAHKLVAKAGGIKVTSEDQKDEMKKARELRLKLRGLRIEANKARISLKEGYLRGGNAVQAIYNDIEKIIKPEEERLEKAEKFAEIKEAERKQARYEKRVAELSAYVADTSIYQLKDMSDEAYAQLLSDSKTTHEAKIEAERKAEADRQEQLRRERILNDRRIEIAPYRDFIPDTAPKLTIDTTDEQFKKMLAEAKESKKKDDADREALRIQAEKDRKAREEAEEKLRKELEAQQKKVREEQERQRAEAAAAAKAKADADEAERQKLLAPDKNKLIEFAAVISTLQSPAVKSKEANDVLLQVEKSLQSISKYIHERAEKL